VFLHPASILWYIIYFAFHAVILIGLVRIINDDDELDMESAVMAVIISTALAMGWSLTADYLELHVALKWLSYVPLAGLIGLAVALVSGIPVVRAMLVGAMYVVFLLSWIVFFILVCGLVTRTVCRHRRFAASRQQLRDRLSRPQPPGDSQAEKES
jgi:hypothetical protein